MSISPSVRRFLALLTVLLTILLLVTTSPKRVPIYMLWFPFFVIGFASYALQHVVLSVWRDGEVRKKDKAGAVLNSVVVVSMLMLNTISRLDIRDIVLLIAMVCIGHFYISRRYP
jgi:predicted MFS family arabinose efflux permease